MILDEVNAAVKCFNIPGKMLALHPFKVGHINETFVSVWLQDGCERRYLHQLVNNYVFRDIAGLMRNVEQVVAHIKEKTPTDPSATLTIIPTLEGKSFMRDPEGKHWRTYVYIENSITYEMCPGSREAYEAARAVGQFLSHLADLPPHNFCDTIPMFHHFPNRFKMLHKTIGKDVEHRMTGAQAEIDFALSREKGAGVIISKLGSGELPLRVTHNDLKLNNVLFDKASGKGLCVVDLDTCMPGSSLYDFGDLVRSVGVSTKEDETDLSKVTVNLDFFKQLARGYVEATRGVLTQPEVSLMHIAPRLLALALGVRFLTDHLAGDIYFKIHHANHNLERARTQFKIVSEMEALENEMQLIVQECY